MRLTARRRAFIALLLVAAPAVLLLGPVLAQAQTAAEVLEVDLDTANCFGHHAAETPPFRTTVLLLPAPVIEVPANTEIDLPVQVQVAWKQEMQSLKVALNLSQAPNLGFTGEKDPFAKDFPGQVTQGTSAEHKFQVEDNATEVVVTLLGDEGPAGGTDLDLFVVGPGGNHTYNKTIEDNDVQGVRAKAGGQPSTIAHEEVRLSQAEILDGGLGEWKALVNYPPTSVGNAAPPVPASYTVKVSVFYNASRSLENFVPVGHDLKAGEITNVTFHLKTGAPGPVTVGLRSLGNAHYIHTDAQAKNDGNFSKTQFFTFTVGSSYKLNAAGRAGVVDITFDPGTRLLRQSGFLLGWLGFFLIPPSLVLGGTFGGGTVRWLNKRVKSARQRVLWHNALSYVLLSIGLTHMTLFLLEVTYPWTLGVVWGSLTLASMIGLGFTGALQNRIAKDYGYATWRFTHFMLGMLVIVGITLHVVVDGVDLQFLRDVFLSH